MVAPSKKQDFLFGGKDDRICSNGQILRSPHNPHPRLQKKPRDTEQLVLQNPPPTTHLIMPRLDRGIFFLCGQGEVKEK
jgi:hypothetical protein